MAEQRKKLRPKCGDSRCEENLHCYHQAQRRSRRASRKTGATANSGGTGAASRAPGSCQVCGAQLVDWERVHRRESTDATHTFEQLKTELIRHFEFHAPLHQHAINYARRKGRRQLRQRLTDHLRSTIGPAQPFHDGWQTSYPDPDKPAGVDIIHAAQHATATCCRKCAEVWHGIPQGRDLTEGELQYLADLATRFIDERLPDLAEEPIQVAAIRRDRNQRSSDSRG